MKKLGSSYNSWLAMSAGLALLATAACSNSLDPAGLSESSEAGGGRSGVTINGGSLAGDGEEIEGEDAPALVVAEDDDPNAEANQSNSLSKISLTVQYESEGQVPAVQLVELVELVHCPAADDVANGSANRFSRNDCKRIELEVGSVNQTTATVIYQVSIPAAPIPLQDLHDFKLVLKPAQGAAAIETKIQRLSLIGKAGQQNALLYDDSNVAFVSKLDGTRSLQTSRSSVRVEEELTPASNQVSVETTRRFKRRARPTQLSGFLLNRSATVVSKRDRSDLNFSSAVIDLKKRFVRLNSTYTFTDGSVDFASASVKMTELGTGVSRSGVRTGPFTQHVGTKMVLELDQEQAPNVNFFPLE